MSITFFFLEMLNIIEPISFVLDENNQTFTTKFTLQNPDEVALPLTIELYTEGITPESAAARAKQSYWTQNYVQLALSTSHANKQLKAEQFVCGDYFIHNLELEQDKLPVTVQLTIQLTSTLVNNLLSYFGAKKHEPVSVKITVQKQQEEN